MQMLWQHVLHLHYIADQPLGRPRASHTTREPGYRNMQMGRGAGRAKNTPLTFRDEFQWLHYDEPIIHDITQRVTHTTREIAT